MRKSFYLILFLMITLSKLYAQDIEQNKNLQQLASEKDALVQKIAKFEQELLNIDKKIFTHQQKIYLHPRYKNTYVFTGEIGSEEFQFINDLLQSDQSYKSLILLNGESELPQYLLSRYMVDSAHDYRKIGERTLVLWFANKIQDESIIRELNFNYAITSNRSGSTFNDQEPINCINLKNRKVVFTVNQNLEKQKGRIAQCLAHARADVN